MRFFAAAALVIAGLMACSSGADDTDLKVTNKSADKTVTFRLLHSDRGTLAPGQTGYYSDYYTKAAVVEAWNSSPVDYRLTPVYPANGEVEFIDTPPVKLIIRNSLGFDITVSCPYMDNKTTPGDSVDILKNDENADTLEIYTKEPEFTILTGDEPCPAAVDYIYNAADETLYVSITVKSE